MGVLDRAFYRLAARVYAGYYATLHVEGLLLDGSRVTPRQYPFDPEVLALSERDALALGGLVAHARMVALVTQGRDGNWAASLMEALGYGTVRGSSERGGARALGGLLRAAADTSAPVAVVVDGPRGPAGRAKAGAVLCALRSGRPLRALGAAARRTLVFPRTWSGIYLPLPCTRVVVACDDPLPLPATWRRDDVRSLAETLSGRLALMRARALEALAATAPTRAVPAGAGVAAAASEPVGPDEGRVR